jgi:cobalt/nickel transport system permease protein
MTRERLDGRVVLVGLLVCIGVTVLTPAGHWERLAGEAALVLAALAGAAVGGSPARRGWRWLLARFALLLPFLLVLLLSMPFMAAAPEQPSAAARAGLAAARATISFAAVAAALQWMELPGLLQALARLRAPALFVTLMSLMLRYLELLEGEAMRMMRARDLRGRPPTVRRRAHVAGCMVGSLCLRSFERAERVSVAMQSRGFSGLLPPPPPRRLTVSSAATLAALLLAQAILVWVT